MTICCSFFVSGHVAKGGKGGKEQRQRAKARRLALTPTPALTL